MKRDSDRLSRHWCASRCRRWVRSGLLAVVLGCPMWQMGTVAASSAHDDTVKMDESLALTEWLSNAGLDEILAAVLDEQVRSATASRPAAIARLSQTYLQLVSDESDPQKIAELSRRIHKFLKREKVEDRGKLRLALARAEYRTALDGIARMRHGQFDQDDRARTDASLLRAMASLHELRDELAASIEENRLVTAGGDEQQRMAIQTRIDESADQLIATKFLQTWCRYWRLWIDRPMGLAKQTIVGSWNADVSKLISSWSDLLETGKPFPEPSDCSIDLIREEYYAQSVLGMSLSKALQQEMEVADRWFALLETDSVWPGLADPSDWYLQALVDSGSYDRATLFVRDAPKSLESVLIAGAALRGFQEADSSPQAHALVRAAAEIAASRADFGSIRELARGVPSVAEGTDFTATLARGILAYDRARSLTAEEEKRALMGAAVVEFTLALSNAPSDPKSVGLVLELLGWAQFGAGHACEASASFGAAAASLKGDLADAALWMGVECAGNGNCPVDERAPRLQFELARAYLARFDSGRHAASAAAVLARAPDAQFNDALAERLYFDAVRGGESGPTRESAAMLIYRRFRAAKGAARAREAGRLLDLPLLSVPAWPRNSVDIVLRQQLEAALDPAVERTSDAKRLLQLVATKYPIGNEPIEIRSELAVRRSSVAFAEKDFGTTLDSIRTIRSIADAAWRPIAEEAFIRSMEAMLAEGSLTPQQIVTARLGIVTARRELYEVMQQSGDPGRANAMALKLGSSLVDAVRAVRMNKEIGIAAPPGLAIDAMAIEALAIARESLAHAPDDAEACGLLADAGVVAGDSDAAYEALTRLVSALPVGSDAWFCRKADLCELLAATRTDEARRMLIEHLALNPDWGSGSGAARLKALALRLGVSGPPTIPVAPVEGGSK